MIETSAAGARGRVLLIDDEPQLLVAYGRILQRAGFEVETLDGGAQVGACLAKDDFDVVISDIGMPMAGGLDVLRGVQAFDRDLPVVLMTGCGELSSALGALADGAQRYLLKPIEPVTLCRAAEDAVTLRRGARLRTAALEVYHEAAREKVRHDELSRQFDRALDNMFIAYQPIVSWSRLEVVAYEALLRTSEPATPNPGSFLAVAESLGRLPEVGRAVRALVAKALAGLPAELSMFVNLHPADLADPALYAPDSPLSAYASRVVLEVTERESLSGFADVAGNVAALRALGYRLAVDDYGSGYGGLGSLVQLCPDIVKIDMGLVRGVDCDATKRKMVESALALCAQLGMTVIAEGVETIGERDALVAAGYDLLQGFLFARPGSLGRQVSLGAAKVATSKGAPSAADNADGNRLVPIDDTAKNRADLVRVQRQLDSGPITVVRLDHQGRITHVNAAWQDFARSNGADEATIEGVGLDYRSVLPADLSGRLVASALDELLAGTRSTFSTVYPCHSPTEPRWFRLDARRVMCDEAVVVMHTNITEQHTAEARLRVQAVVAQALVERTPLVETCRRFVSATCEGLEWDFAAVWITSDCERLRCVDTWTRPDFDARPFDASGRAVELSRGEGLAGRVWESQSAEWIRDLHFDPRWTCPGRLAPTLRSGFAIPLAAEGDVFAVIEFFSRIQREPDQALVELLVTSGTRLGARALQERAEQRAITAEAAQRSMRSTLDAIMQCVPAFIIAVDERGLIRFMNRVMPHLRMEDVIGSDSLMYVPEADREEQRLRRERCIATGVSETVESIVTGPDGNKLVFSTHMSPMRQGDTIVGVVLVTYDVTDVRRNEQELAATQRMAAVGTLAAGVAHEINTPVQFVNDSVHFLRDSSLDAFTLIQDLVRVARIASREPNQSPALAEALAIAARHEADADLPYLRENIPKAFERCLDGLDRVTTIVRSLKEYAHPTREEMAPSDLNRAIQNTLTIARSEYKYIADLETELGDIPPVTCHLNDINQVVLNLVVNAAHAIADVVQGTAERGRIKVRTALEGSNVLISISDTGSGIAPEIAHRIFEPFFTTKEVGRGSGQGLALAWAVVRGKHGGDLTFESAVGRGTTFVVRLPVQGKSALRKDTK